MHRLIPRPIARTLTALLLAGALVGGCAYKNALERGDQAMTAQRYEEAVREYQQALTLKPDSPEAKQKLTQAQDKAVEVRATAARTKLQSGNFPGAIADAAGALAILPDSALVRGLVDEVVAGVSAEGERRSGAADFAGAVALFDAVIAGLPGSASKVQGPRQASVDRWIAALGAGATAAEAAGRRGDALLQRAMITELTSDPAAASERDRLLAALRTELTFRVQQVKPGPLAARLAGADPTRWLEVAAGPSQPAAASLSFALTKPKFGEEKRDRSESARYQSGTKQVPNPFYKSQQDDVSAQERRLLEAEKEVTNQEKYVQQYSADVAREGDTPGTSTGAEQNLSNAQSRLESARNRVNSERDALQRERDELARTEQTREEPVYSELTYKITTHTRHASARLTGVITGVDGTRIDINRELSERAEDATNEAQTVANIAEDPLQLPSKEELAARLEVAAIAEVATALGAAFAAYRQSFRDAAQKAASDDERVDRLVIFTVMDRAAADPTVDETLRKLRGVPGATALLQRAAGGK